MADYRAGRRIETIRRTRAYGPSALRAAQQAYLDALPPPETAPGFRARLASALLHADAVAQLALGRYRPTVDQVTFVQLDQRRSPAERRRRSRPQNPFHDLLRGPLAELPEHWPAGTEHLRGELAAAWGPALTSRPEEALVRELVLGAARARFARLDVVTASGILEVEESGRDPVLVWQLASVRAARARLVREDGLWRQVTGGFSEAESRSRGSAAALRRSPRTAAVALGDPDDRNLRLALVALGQNQASRARSRLRDVTPEPAPRLRVPKLLLEAELRLSESRFAPAAAGLEAAARLSPDSQAVVAALVVSLQAAGRRDVAAALASDFLALDDRTQPWMSFLMTWAETRDPGLELLRLAVESG